jgi:hypothetical protein
MSVPLPPPGLAAESEAIDFLTRFGRARRFRRHFELATIVGWGRGGPVIPIEADVWFAQFFVEWFMFDFLLDDTSQTVADHALVKQGTGLSRAARHFIEHALATPLQVTRVHRSNEKMLMLHDILDSGRQLELTDPDAVEQLVDGELFVARLHTLEGMTRLIGTTAILAAEEEAALLQQMAALQEHLRDTPHAGMVRAERMAVSSAIVAFVGRPVVARAHFAASNPGIGRLQ